MTKDEEQRILKLVLAAQRLKSMLVVVQASGAKKPRVLLARENLAIQADVSLSSSGGGRGSGPSDPTLSAVQAQTERVEVHGVDKDGNPTVRYEWRPTPAARFATEQGIALATLDEELGRAAASLEKAWRIIESNSITVYHKPDNEPACQVCASAKTFSGKPHPEAWQLGSRAKAPTNCPDADDIRRCSFHWEWLERLGVEAAPAITTWHLDHPGSRIPKGMIRDHHPDAWKRHYDPAGRGGRMVNLAALELGDIQEAV